MRQPDKHGSLLQALKAGKAPDGYRLQLGFDLPTDPLLEAGESVLGFELGLDDLVWEK